MQESWTHRIHSLIGHGLSGVQGAQAAGPAHSPDEAKSIRDCRSLIDVTTNVLKSPISKRACPVLTRPELYSLFPLPSLIAGTERCGRSGRFGISLFRHCAVLLNF